MATDSHASSLSIARPPNFTRPPPRNSMSSSNHPPFAAKARCTGTRPRLKPTTRAYHLCAASTATNGGPPSRANLELNWAPQNR